jgi:tetratricopeptide (TPR) repeat protein
VIPLLILLAAPAVIGPPSPDSAESRYRQCTDMIRSSPDRAIAYAGDWQSKGGGLHARQCLGLAYSKLGRWPEAAAAFEQAARDAETVRDSAAADFWVQSGNAWLAGADPLKAKAAFNSALGSTALTPLLRGEVHLDRGRAEVALNDLTAARRDFDKALELAPTDAFAWYVSAALARRQRDLARAQADIAKAVSLAPDDAEVLLEAGTIAGLSGEVDAAQGLYMRAARAAPNSDTARRALDAIAANGGEARSTAPRPPAN